VIHPDPVFSTNRIPQPVTALAGEDVMFSVVNSGSTPFGYRWRRNGAAITTAPSAPVLLLTNVQTAQSGSYTVIITNFANAAPGILAPALGQMLAQLHVYADVDGDKAGDSWETRFGFSPSDPADGGADTDGDGMKNFEEFRAGTDPNDPTSYLKVDQISLAAGANITFIARATNSYTVQYRDSLAAGTWNKLTDVSARTTNRTVTVTDPGATGNRFYRLLTPYSQQ